MEELNQSQLLSQCLLHRTPLEWTRLLAQLGILVLVVTGNSLVIVSIIVAKVLRNPRNLLVLSLALADLLVGLFGLPFKIYLIENCYVWKAGSVLCHMWITGDTMLATVSILSLTAISIDRYFAIKKPLYHHVNFSRTKIYGLITIAWIFPLTLVIPYWCLATLYHEATIVNSTAVTLPACFDDAPPWSWHHIVWIIGSFFLPLTILLFVYGSIARVLKKQHAKFTKTATSTVVQSAETHPLGYSFLHEMKGFIMTGIVLVCFVICWLPYFNLILIQAMYKLAGKSLSVTPWIYEIFVWLAYSHSCANPFIYTMFSPDFRYAFKELINLRCSTINSRMRRNDIGGHRHLSQYKDNV